MPRRTSHSRASPTVAWTVAGIAVLGIGVTFVGALVEPSGGDRIEALWVLSWIGMPAVGAAIASRRPGNRVGRLLLGIGFGIGVGLLTESYAMVVGIGPGDGSALIAVWWTVGVLGFALAFGLIPLLLLSFPDGRSAGRPATWLERGTVALLGLCALSWVVRDQASVSGGEPFPNPLAPPVVGTLAEAAVAPLTTALVGCAVLAVVLAVLRYRRSTGIERLQLRWFAFAAIALPVLLVVGTLAETVGETFGDLVFYMGWVLGLNGIAVAIGIAVLRHRLYEIDRVISRTVTYAVVTVALVVVYAAVAVLPSALFALDSDLLVAAATLAAAGAFMPLRRRVQARVDRRFNRSRHDAYRLVDRFGERVRTEFDLEDLAADLRRVVAATVQPAHLSLWTDARDGALDGPAGRGTRR